MIRAFTVLVLIVGLPSLAFADHDAHHEGPCKKIIENCEAGGYKMGAHKATGKGVMIDCLNKILKGETVAGVTATPEEIKGCSAVKAKHHKK